MELGELGEQLAASYVGIRHGYRPLYRNFVAPKGGEVDLICRDGDILAFVEVKSRRGFESGSPARAVDRGKEALITRGAMHWLRLLGHPDVNFRFDVVEVLLEDGEVPRINLIKGTFELPEPIRY